MDRPRLIRGLRIAWSVWWGILCVLLVVLWLRSYSTSDRLHWSFLGKESIAAASKQGRFLLLRYDNVPQPNAWKNGWYSHSTTDEQSFPMGDIVNKSYLGFEMIQQPPYFIPELKEVVPGKPGVVTIWNPGVMFLKGSGVMVPDWFLILVVAALSAAPWIPGRFSLRTLLIATTLIAVVLGLVVIMRH